MKKIISVLLLICTLAGCLASCSSDGSPDGYQLVSDEKEIFELYVPKSWVSNLSSGVASAYASHKNKTLVSARTTTDARQYSADEFLKMVLMSYEKMDGYELISEPQQTTLGGQPGYVFEYKTTITEFVNFMPVAVEYKFKTVIAKSGSSFVTLTYCAPEKNYNGALKDFDSIISKFVFKAVEVDPDGYQKVSGESEIFNLFVPTTWVSNLASGISSAYAPVESRVLVSARTIREARNYTLREFMSVALEGYETMNGYEIVVAPTETTLAGQSAYVMEYKATVTEADGNKEKDVVYKFKVYVAKLEATFTTLTYCAPIDVYDSYAAELDSIVGKFEFKSFKDGELEKDDFMDTTTNAPEGYQFASSDKYEFNFYVPITWTVQRRTYNPKAYYSLTDLSNVTINTKKADEYVYDGKTYWEDFVSTSPFEITDVVIDENAKMGGKDAYAVEYVENISGVKYSVKQVFLAYNSMIYVFTYTSTKANYAKHLDDIDKMLEMFELK